jgi:MFS transporter, DHA1 family, multidrug resistance protein
VWFEAFPLVFVDIYHFKLGVSGLPFAGIIVGAMVSFTCYCAYIYYYLNPKWMRTGGFPPEERLKLAIVSGFTIPISLFIFGLSTGSCQPSILETDHMCPGWTSRPSVHWIGPVIGAAIYMPGIYLLFQCVLVYLPMAYPHHAASVYAANDFFRSSLASAFP